MTHLVYCDDKEKVLEKILAGTKTMVVRGAAGRKIPHSRVFEGEEALLYEKRFRKDFCKSYVKNVQNFIKLKEEEINAVFENNKEKLGPVS
jgi:hypothetical protein